MIFVFATKCSVKIVLLDMTSISNYFANFDSQLLFIVIK